MRRGLPRAAVALVALLGILALVEIDTARKVSVTCDEVAHLGAGVALVQHGELRLGLENPPLTKLFAGSALAACGIREGSAAAVWSRSASLRAVRETTLTRSATRNAE